MKCKLPAGSVKLLAKAIHTLAKIGSEIYIEPLEEGLALKTVNSSRSGYASFLFQRAVFQTYEHLISDKHEDDYFKCKVAVKTLLQVFKSISSIEKSVESCDLHLDEEECRLVFQLKCRYGIVKTHQLTFQECESLQAVFAKDLSPNVLQCEHKLLNDVVINFPTLVEEITLNVSPCEVRFRSYFDAVDPNAPVLKTEMTLNPSEFTDFQVGVDTEVTFCLKSLRAVLGFCDVADMPVNFHFETGGKPLVLSVEDENSFKAHLVLATISDEHLWSQQSTKTTLPSKTKNTKLARSNKDFAKRKSVPHCSRTTEPSHHPNRQNVATSSRCDRSVINGDSGANEASPEIPIQDYPAAESTTKRKLSPSPPNEPIFQAVKKVFFEPTQPENDRSVIVLAPDSDEENS